MSVEQEQEPEGIEIADHEPDYRFTLANERTYLAWIRTSLGFLACSVAVHQFLAPATIPVVGSAITALCVLLALALPIGALRQWRRVQRAMRRDGSLPTPPTLRLVAVSMILLAGCTAVAVILS